jgi:hypothetical protein
MLRLFFLAPVSGRERLAIPEKQRQNHQDDHSKNAKLCQYLPELLIYGYAFHVFLLLIILADFK